ncbi:hypothetical protein F7725_000289 [Dissostichus mawsoni]|uniref:Uncharacterized protein n=1 Tax=Dissostichus mawsoni TaxID=36200 RepID=A0A7J5ZDZ4_DISMA|nr:hypothetical protein F7725_000289 [Dissostichus mawsoni]
MKGWSFSGMTMPSSVWMAHITRVVAHMVAFSMCTYSASDAEAPGLVVEAVGAGDQLSEGPGAREPGLQVQLLTGSVVQGASDLLKLVHSEDPARVSAVGAHFLSEAGGEAGVADGQVLGFQPLVPQEGGDGLLRGGDQLIIKLAELRHFLHDLFPHEEGRVERGVVLAVEEPQAVVDESLLQEHHHHSPPLSVEAIDHDHQVHVGVLLLHAGVAPAPHLIVADGHSRVQEVSDLPQVIEALRLQLYSLDISFLYSLVH